MARLARKQLPYREGDWIAIPLEGGGFALVLAARVSRGGAILGYFFGPRRRAVPAPNAVITLRPDDAVLIAIFGDLGILYNEWQVICSSPAWSREKWPMPAFGRIDSVDPTRAYRTEYNENNLVEALYEYNIRPEEAARLPADAVCGYGSIEIQLDRLLERSP